MFLMPFLKEEERIRIFDCFC